jgi:hypothetical protein
VFIFYPIFLVLPLYKKFGIRFSKFTSLNFEKTSECTFQKKIQGKKILKNWLQNIYSREKNENAENRKRKIYNLGYCEFVIHKGCIVFELSKFCMCKTQNESLWP